jgi:lysozyme
MSCIGAEVAKEQASWFVSNTPADEDALPPVLDVEWNSHSKTCPHHIAREAAIAKIKIMLKAMEAHSGKRPIIYTDPKFHSDVLEGELPNYHFWLRSVAATPEEKYEARNWVFWQFTTTGRVRGVAGPVDRNSFNGHESRLAARAEGAMHLRDRNIDVGEGLASRPFVPPKYRRFSPAITCGGFAMQSGWPTCPFDLGALFSTGAPAKKFQ